MARIIVFHLLVFAVPFIAWVAYVYLVRREVPPDGVFDGAPNVWLAVTGMVMTITVFILVAVFTGAGTQGIYQPPQMIDGEIVPGHFTTPDPASDG